MTTSDDRLRILRMIESGQITAEDGAQLLAALDEDELEPARPTARWIRVQVTDGYSGRQKVNLNVPVGLLGVGMRLGARFAGKEAGALNIDELLARIKAGETGKLIDIEDQNGERVQIIVE
jgi:hypothetical protein